ncbi:MAG: L,D-transpeptidase [Patescibacteria group bacterium]
MKRIALLFTSFVLFFVFSVSPAQAQISTTDKLITVDRGSQTLTAWQNGQIQHQTKVSTGMHLTPTLKGSFSIKSKYAKQDMRGSSPYKYIYPSGKYYIKDVPYVMYYSGAYAIHGAPWNYNLGRPASHGCVNVSVASAEWLFAWSDIGTRVEVF